MQSVEFPDKCCMHWHINTPCNNTPKYLTCMSVLLQKLTIPWPNSVCVFEIIWLLAFKISNYQYGFYLPGYVTKTVLRGSFTLWSEIGLNSKVCKQTKVKFRTFVQRLLNLCYSKETFEFDFWHLSTLLCVENLKPLHHQSGEFTFVQRRK